MKRKTSLIEYSTKTYIKSICTNYDMIQIAFNIVMMVRFFFVFFRFVEHLETFQTTPLCEFQINK